MELDLRNYDSNFEIAQFEFYIKVDDWNPR